MGELNFCRIADIIKAAVTQSALDLPNDFGLPFWFIRLLHNKPYYFSFYSLRCYLLYFDILQIAKYASVVFLPFIVMAFWGKTLRKILIAITLIFPLFEIINPLHLNLRGQIDALYYFYLGLAIAGGMKLILVIWKRITTRS